MAEVINYLESSVLQISCKKLFHESGIRLYQDLISFRYLATIGLVGYVCAYSFSFGPVTWVILSEIFPAATKGRAMAFTTSFNWLGNFIVSATFLQATRKKNLTS